MSLVRQWVGKLRSRFSATKFTPLRSPTSGWQMVDKDSLLGEERHPAFRGGLYYPMQLGEILTSRYQVVGKLGFGTTSTVWLAHDMQTHQHVSLKVYTKGESHDDEFRNHQIIARAQVNSKHPGRNHVRSALDTFTIERNDGNHQCLVQKPMWDSFSDLLMRNPVGRFAPELMKLGLQQIFLALDFLHTECRLVHSDIKGDNLMIKIEDESILHDFVNEELVHPSARKVIDGKTIYESRGFGMPKTHGMVVLSDFGEVVNGDETRHHNAQPNYFRSPEVMLQADWSYPVDIWNVGVMIWDLFEGRYLFTGQDPDGKGYSTRAHLAELIGMLGPPPPDFLQRGRRVEKYFDKEGRFIADIPILQSNLEDGETSLEGGQKEASLKMIRSMLQWRPEDRKTAKELLNDPWLYS